MQKKQISAKMETISARTFTDADLERIERQIVPLLNTVRAMRAQFREQEARIRGSKSSLAR